MCIEKPYSVVSREGVRMATTFYAKLLSSLVRETKATINIQPHHES